MHKGLLKVSIEILNFGTQLFEKTSCSSVPFVVKRFLRSKRFVFVTASDHEAVSRSARDGFVAQNAPRKGQRYEKVTLSK